MDLGIGLRAAAKSAAVLIALSSCLAGCMSARALDVQKPPAREERINSLALEQCIRENGEQGCRNDTM
jgi:hypothetical protein